MTEYMRAFNVLHATRQSGMGPNPIQLTEILAYLQIYGTDDVDRFVKYIQYMDNAYLEAYAKKAEAEARERERQAEAKAKQKG